MQPVKDFDFNMRAGAQSGTLQQFAQKAGIDGDKSSTVDNILKSGNLYNYLSNKGNLEMEIMKKGMKKSEAAKLAGKFMNNQELRDSR